MTRKFLFSTAAAVGVLAAGGAYAADPNPVVVAPVVAAPVVVPGPVYTVTVNAWVEASNGGWIEAAKQTEVDIRLPSGLGVEVGLYGELDFVNGLDDGALALGARLYKAFGDATVGLYATTWRDFYFPGTDRNTQIGIDADYETDTTEAYAYFGFDWYNGVYEGFNVGAWFETTLRDRFVLVGNTYLYHPNGGPSYGDVYGQFGYKLGPVTPYVGVWFDWEAGFGIDDWEVVVGAEFEHKIGEALTLTAGVEVWFDAFGYDGWAAEAGFEYAVGDGPLTIRGHVGTFGGFDWHAGLGISLKFGGN